jgi:hypothetical protein
VFLLGDDNLTVFPDRDRNVAFMENDFSSFDTTHNEYSWALQKKIFLNAGVPTDVLDYMEVSARNLTITTERYGGSYHCVWNMASGNPNTCSGNSIVNFGTTFSMLMYRGDDMRNCRARNIDDYYKDLGFEPKIKFTNTASLAVFLQGTFFHSNSTRCYYWVPLPFRTIVKCSFIANPNVAFADTDYQYAMYECYKHLSNIPIFRAFLYCLQSRGQNINSNVKSILGADSSRWYKPQFTAPYPDDLGQDFANRYGLTENLLRQIEMLMIVQFNTGAPVADAWFRTLFMVDVPDYAP